MARRASPAALRFLPLNHPSANLLVSVIVLSHQGACRVAVLFFGWLAGCVTASASGRGVWLRAGGWRCWARARRAVWAASAGAGAGCAGGVAAASSPGRGTVAGLFGAEQVGPGFDGRERSAASGPAGGAPATPPEIPRASGGRGTPRQKKSQRRSASHGPQPLVAADLDAPHAHIQREQDDGELEQRLPEVARLEGLLAVMQRRGSPPGPSGRASCRRRFRRCAAAG